MRLSRAMGDALDRQRGHLLPWAPVLYGAGIGAYFALRAEPGRDAWLAVVALMALGLVLGWRSGDRARLVLAAALLLLAGFATAGLRAHRVAGVTLDSRYYGPVEGRIVGIDRSASDALRLTLDRVVLAGRGPGTTPARVRVALHGTQGHFRLEPGVTVILTGHLAPPGGPVEPGGYDFRRQAWFDRLGAVGYTRTPVLALAPHAGGGAALWVYRLRMRISAAVMAALTGQAGAFATAITTGDRSGIDAEVLADLRVSNLAHLLAISGLHMGLLTRFVFAALRLGFAAVPRIALSLPAKKIAAVGAFAAAVAYLAISGRNVATERAFVMVAVMLLAVLVDRRAITLRAVAVAALIVLAIRPEALYGPGFQMSFAATAALVAVYGQLRDRGVTQSRWPAALRVLGGTALSSLVAGLATAPIAAAHFNQVPHYGLVANVVSVPLMGAVIIPGAVLAACLSPLGLAWIGLWLMKYPILWILWVAGKVADWPGAASPVIAPGPVVLPLIALGALWLALWQGRARLLGVPAMAAALTLWSHAERPAILVSESGGLVGVMTGAGRALSKPKGDGFAAGTWLENDGDRVDQAAAFARPGFEVEGRMRWFRVGGAQVLHATGKTAAAAAMARCGEAALVIVNVRATAPAGCRVYDARHLARTGALAISPGPEGPVVVAARDRGGARLWSQ